MKKLLVILLAVFLLSGCEQTNPEETTVPTTEPTTKATTAPATAPTTAPTEPEPTVLEPELWLTDPQYPSYEEFLVTDPEMTLVDPYSVRNLNSWLITEVESGIAYRLTEDPFEIKSSVSDLAYRVPNTGNLERCRILAADGKHAYINDDIQILKIDLVNGEVVGTVETGKVMVQSILDGLVMYYMEYDGEHFNACRIYLPEMKLDILGSFVAPPKVYLENGTSYIDGSMRWIIFNPKLLDFAEKELENPESACKKLMIYGQEHDFSDMWTNEKFWDEDYLIWQDMFWYGVQEKSGIRAFEEYHYHPEDGTLTTRIGIIDGCSFGTGESHDHFNPDITEIVTPKLVNSSWMPAPGQDIQGPLPPKPEGSVSLEQCGFSNSPEKLFLYEKGYYTEFADVAFKMRLDQEDAIYGITQDNKLVQLSYDGTVCNTLYTGENTLRGLVIHEGCVYFADGDELLKLDLAENQYRVLVKQEYLSSIGYHTQDDKAFIYFNASAGMARERNAYNIETEQLEDVTAQQ